MHFSNTFALVKRGWNAVEIEGDPVRFRELQKLKIKYQQIIPILAYVSSRSDDPTSLDKLLATTSVPMDFELLSIDIDSYDLDVWESLQNYYPKIVVIEINSAIPPGILSRHGGKSQGNSFSSTLKVAQSKGYTLVCHTGNMIFVKNDLMAKIGLPKRYIEFPELLFIDKWQSSGSTFKFNSKILNQLFLKFFDFLKNKSINYLYRFKNYLSLKTACSKPIAIKRLSSPAPIEAGELAF